MKRTLAVCLILSLFCGCSSLTGSGRKAFSKKESSLGEKERRIAELEADLADCRRQIKEKDDQIRQLQGKLRILGVF